LEQEMGIDWFRHEPLPIVMAGFLPGNERSHKDDGRVGHGGIPANFRGYFPAVFAGHVHIHEDEIRPKRFRGFECGGRAIFLAEGVAPYSVEDGAQEAREFWVIVNDHNFTVIHNNDNKSKFRSSSTSDMYVFA